MAFNTQKLAEHITATPALAGLSAAELVTWYEEDVTQTYNRKVNWRDIMAEFGASAAAILRDLLTPVAETDSGVSMVLMMLKEYGDGGGLDMGDVKTIEFIDQLVTDTILTAGQANSFKSMGERQVSKRESLSLRFAEVKLNSAEEALAILAGHNARCSNCGTWSNRSTWAPSTDPEQPASDKYLECPTCSTPARIGE